MSTQLLRDYGPRLQALKQMAADVEDGNSELVGHDIEAREWFQTVRMLLGGNLTCLDARSEADACDLLKKLQETIDGTRASVGLDAAAPGLGYTWVERYKSNAHQRKTVLGQQLSTMSDKTWLSIFGMKREAVISLIGVLRPYLEPKRGSNRNAGGAELKVLAALAFLRNGEVVYE